MWPGLDNEPVAGRFDICDSCHDDYAIDVLFFTGTEFLCQKCNRQWEIPEIEKNNGEAESQKMSSQK